MNKISKTMHTSRTTKFPPADLYRTTQLLSRYKILPLSCACIYLTNLLPPCQLLFFFFLFACFLLAFMGKRPLPPSLPHPENHYPQDSLGFLEVLAVKSILLLVQVKLLSSHHVGLVELQFQVSIAPVLVLVRLDHLDRITHNQLKPRALIPTNTVWSRATLSFKNIFPIQ